MINLIKKEFKLSMHPTVPIFLSFAAMLMIPNYPYYVTAFYTTLSIFFTCLTGRENNDITYSLMLPVAKKDIVKGRLLFTMIIEVIQILLFIPFIILNQKINPQGNVVGTDANIAFIGFTFILYGIFNYVFFSVYYKNVLKVGKAFISSNIAIFIYIVVIEVLMHVIPFFRDYLDTNDTENVSYKLIVLFAGIILYLLISFVTYKKSSELFEKLDLS